MDEGAPIAYELLEKGVPVLGSDGQQVGTVHHVVAEPRSDIFHGLVISVPGGGRRFVAADEVASLHERGADLAIDGAAVAALPEPGGGAAAFTEDPGEMKGWHHWMHVLTLRGDWKAEE
jgi:hypothetical protein